VPFFFFFTLLDALSLLGKQVLKTVYSV